MGRHGRFDVHCRSRCSCRRGRATAPKRKLTQRQLAKALGREQNLIGRIETGQRRVDLIEWISICHACGADPEAETLRLLRLITHLVPKNRQVAKDIKRSQ